MKRFIHTEDNNISITNDGTFYIDTLENFLLDYAKPYELNSDYISLIYENGVSTLTKKENKVEWNPINIIREERANPELDTLIEDLETLIAIKAARINNQYSNAKSKLSYSDILIDSELEWASLLDNASLLRLTLMLNMGREGIGDFIKESLKGKDLGKSKASLNALLVKLGSNKI